MKKIAMKKFDRVEAPIGEYKDIIAFQMIEFSINFFGHEETFVLDTKITKEGQFVIDGNGWIKEGYEIKEEVKTVEEKEVVQTVEVIEEVQEIVNVTEKKYFVGREVEGKTEALAYQTGYGVHWTEDLSSETVGIYTLEEITEKMKWISNSDATIQEVKQEIAPEATKEEITAIEEAEAIETTISFKTAESAFRNISFTPEVRAKSIIASSNKEINNFLSELLVLAPEEKENIILDVKDWASKYDNKKTMWLNAMSRTASAMITGPANFPTARNNKRNETAHNRSEELLDWMEKSKKALIKKYSPKPKIKTIFEEVEEVKKADRKGYFKSLDKESLTAKLFNYANISLENLQEVKEIALKETSLFTSKHKIHRMIESLEKKFNRISEGAANKEEIINNIKIVDSEENNRIELYFEGIPTADIRNHLKSKGFKWSPTKKAWQNFRSSLRLQEIKKYIETIGA